LSLTESRVKKLRSRLAEEELDGMYVTYITNVRYLSGFTGSPEVASFWKMRPGLFQTADTTLSQNSK